MNAITKFDLSPRQIALVQQTVAKDCNAEEFNLFMEVARAKGLDPFLGQIIPMVFSKNNANKRRMTIIISRDGQRVIAQRCGDYRPASKPATYELDASLKSPLNPQGIVSATVYLWKQDPKSGEWYEVAGQSYWEEFAPIKDEWAENEKTGKNYKTGKQTLDDSGNWCRMPRLMIAKCAEMQALRAGWPEQFTGLYDEAEMDRAKIIDLTASEIVEHEREENRLKAVGASNSITITWGDNWALENVPVGEFFDRACEFIEKEPPAKIAKWRDANREPLKMFWSKHPGDALELKRRLEAAIARPAAKGPSDAELRSHPLMAG
ncbi:phage recombination protein Bet [Sinorhizobium kummerowiae]|uniref:Phage recombination protein Bet n=1 Tax=Sinorhizobium kummerowiae TaxID=158892 RepID=A0ABY8TBK2_9HYPH|nr:phage recombination protein Bet [Sinorhizobium kummerowiae]WHS94629.1 phage recombination protein Bet [Sinorhizobium kummerowiae]WRW46573.1 phage recombination protein Bet [Sinorhizobium kummerowiae]